MSKKNSKSESVFIEGNSVVTTSPYEKFNSPPEFEYEYVSESQKPTRKSERQLRLECINSAINSGAKDPERILDLATLFWRFIKEGG